MPEAVIPRATTLSEAQFERISALVKDLCGINLHDGKKELVKARLGKRLRQLGIQGFEQYIDYVEQDAGGDELVAMLDALSTNLTSFFRESAHFDHLAEVIAPRAAARARGVVGRFRAWSAGCSSGEEPFSMAITLAERLPDFERWDMRILATDLSTKVLRKAEQGVYPPERLRDVTPQIRQGHFVRIGTRKAPAYQVRPEIRRLIHFARLNLMDPWPMRGPFDVIFCRNVMIYFDKSTQGKLVQRFWELLSSGGTLFIGHSESLAGVTHRFKYAKPTVYEKP